MIKSYLQVKKRLFVFGMFCLIGVNYSNQAFIANTHKVKFFETHQAPPKTPLLSLEKNVLLVGIKPYLGKEIIGNNNSPTLRLVSNGRNLILKDAEGLGGLSKTVWPVPSVTVYTPTGQRNSRPGSNGSKSPMVLTCPTVREGARCLLTQSGSNAGWWPEAMNFYPGARNFLDSEKKRRYTAFRTTFHTDAFPNLCIRLWVCFSPRRSVTRR